MRQALSPTHCDDILIQVAGGQYTPRIIATTLLRDNVIRYTVGLFVFTFLFAIAPVIQKLKAWREANNLSQAQAVVVLVAAGLPANVKTLQGWEIGRHSPQPITAAALARFLEKNSNVSHPSARTTFLHAPQLECQEMKNQEV